MHRFTRRRLLASSLATGAAVACSPLVAAEPTKSPAEPIIDIHQHTNYRDRTNDALLAPSANDGRHAHDLAPRGQRCRAAFDQRRQVQRPRRCEGRRQRIVRRDGSRSIPASFYFGANEVTDLPEARYEIEKYLKLGGVIIGEQKFSVECDSRESQRLYELAAEYQRADSAALPTRHLQPRLRALRQDARKASEDDLHRPRSNLVGQHRQEPRRSNGALPERPGDGRRLDRSLSRRLPEHVRRHVGRLRPECPDCATKTTPAASSTAIKTNSSTAATATTPKAKARNAPAAK